MTLKSINNRYGQTKKIITRSLFAVSIASLIACSQTEDINTQNPNPMLADELPVNDLDINLDIVNDDKNGQPILDGSGDVLIFGHFYGQCQGEQCVETFKITAEGLLEDVVDDYNHKSFDFTAVNNNTFTKIKPLFDTIPTFLLAQEEGTIGCPDCADGGGIFIQYEKDGVVKAWRIDKNLQYVPKDLHNFVNKINKSLLIINPK